MPITRLRLGQSRPLSRSSSAVEGLPFAEEQDFLAVALAVFDAASVEVTYLRGGAPDTRIFYRD